MRVFDGADSLRAAVDEEIGVGSWIEVTQNRIDMFAEATNDRQWIHVDPERAAEGPFAGTIAHGYLTLSLLSAWIMEVSEVTGTTMAVNYGLNRVRWPAPVPVGSRLRGRVTLAEVEDIAGGVQVTWQVSVEREGSERPVCVAENLNRLYFSDAPSSEG